MMKKVIAAIVSLMCLGIVSRAQVIIMNDNVYHERMGEIKARVVDSLTNEPVPFASVYVIPSKDTTITNFTLSNEKGEAKLDEVPFGSYVFRVEMMGYLPFVRERYFREKQVDMGTIRLQADQQYLQAATVTDVGNPIIIKKDTVEFHASSFRVGANDMLKDLLLRMPGMEITEDGKVKFNGQPIDKITVGGRTFFFDDQSTALNNLPASVVDKIRVIDRDSEQTRASGLQDGEQEKVLDVALKKEYEKGWFGNVGFKGGSTLAGKGEENPLRDNRGLLWGANGLLSGYTGKDQVTIIANGQNIDDSGVLFSQMDEEGNISVLDQGLSTATQLGFNANTARIKKVETTAGIIFKHTDTDSGDRADRTTYQDDGILASSTQERGKQYATSLNANQEFQKEEGKVWFHIRPSFKYGKTDDTVNGVSETFREGAFVNSSKNTTHHISLNNTAGMETDISFRDLWGKEGRTIRFNLDGEYGVESGSSEESTSLRTVSETDARQMRYVSAGQTYGADSHIRFTEPIGDSWKLSAMGGLNWSNSRKNRNAFDGAGHNDYYSSHSRVNYMEQQYDLTAQYEFGDDNWLTLGGRVYGVLNETHSRSFGFDDTVGEGEWKWHFAPTVRFQYSKKNDEFSVYLTGYGMPPSTSRMQPVLNISDPARLSLGNEYLKPSSQMYFSIDWTRNNPERFSTLMVILFNTVNTSPVTQARWTDSDGIQYSISVNALKPSVNSTFMVDYTTPLDSRKNWFISLSGYAIFSSSTSYLATTSLPGLDKDAFNYAAFMADFWGNAGGDRFYGGKSGFSESRTNTLNPNLFLSVKYNPGRFSLAFRANTEGHIARYSLDPGINLNTLDTRLGIQGSYTTKHEFEFNTDLSYNFYKGYAEGYGRPEWQWDAEINKSLGAFNLSMKVHDILNQTQNLTHTVRANFEEDRYRLVMGRYIIFGVKWNFGKMNAAHSQRARQAAMDMVF